MMSWLGSHTWGLVEVFVLVVLSQHQHRLIVLLRGLISAQHAQVVGVQHHEGEAGMRAEAVGVDASAALRPAQPPLGVQGAVEPGAQQRRPAEVVELVVAPHMVDLRGTRVELLEHHLQRSLRGAAASVEAVDDVTELEDKLRSDSRLGPTLEGSSEELHAGAVVALPCAVEVVSVVDVRVLNVGYHTEGKQRRLLRAVGHSRRGLWREKSRPRASAVAVECCERAGN